jgi:hypothetical protein
MTLTFFLFGKAVGIGTVVRLKQGQVLPIDAFNYHSSADEYPILLIDEDEELLLPHVSDIVEMF